MLYRLRFRTDRLTLPMAYQNKVQGLLYNLMRSVSETTLVPDYSTFLHDSGYDAGRGARFKLFCFGRLNGSCQRRGRQICFPKGVELSVRTADPTLGELLDEAFRPGLVCELAGQTIVLEEAERETLHLTGSALNIRMDSPLCVYTALPGGKTRSINPLEEDFSRLVNENYRRKWSVIAGAPPEDDITLTARSVGMQDKVVTNVKGIWVTAWGGSYRLTGSPRALEFLYHTGLGGRNSMGFGLFNILP